MVGISPPPPVDLATARARGPPPPWMQGPVAPSVSGPLSTPQGGTSMASGVMPPNLPTSGPPGPAPAFTPSMQMQFRSTVPLQPQPGQGFLPSNSPQFRSVMPPPPPSMPGVTPPSITPVQPPSMSGVGPPSVATMHPPSIPGMGFSNASSLQPGVPPSQGLSFNQQQRPLSGVPAQAPQQTHALNLPPPGAVRVTPPPSFSLAASAAYSHQNYGAIPSSIPVPTIRPPGQAPLSMPHPWPLPSSQITSSGAPQQGLTGQQNSLTVNSVLGQTGLMGPPFSLGSDWQEHIAPDGRRYYYNRRTKHSSWEKPVELMTPLERADASTVWKEFTTADGRKYYYNKLTKQSKWTLPEELKVAREQAEKVANPAFVSAIEAASVSAAAPALLSPPSAVTEVPNGATISSIASVPASSKPSSPSPEGMVAVKARSPIAPEVVLSTPDISSSIDKDATMENAESAAQPNIEQSTETEAASVDMAVDEASAQEIEDVKKAMPSAGKVNVTPVTEVKPATASEEAEMYTNKAEAKNAFKKLLEDVHVESDWTWEQAMRHIINDKRYGALKNLNERKQAFSEFLAHKKKHEAEEKRIKQKKAREEFIIMMQESKELSSKMRWSKVVSLLGDDPRFRAVERDRDREELFQDYTLELEAKEKERAREERKTSIMEYRKYLQSCDFVKANTQWRKVADKFVDDERWARLTTNDLVDVFQEYVRDLLKAEEEEMKILKEQQRRMERKNRDDFRKLMEEHRKSGLLHGHVLWRDYAVMVKDHPAFVAVESNKSGTTSKELFEDAKEDMEKEYSENKPRIKDAMKAGKINVTSEWTFEIFKAALIEAGDVAEIPESNFKFIFDDLIERAKEREEKEAKRKRRAADEFNELLRAEKTILATSTWEDCKEVVENTAQFRAVHDDLLCKKMFDDYVDGLQQKAKEKERKREEEKAKKEKEGEKERERRKEKEKREKDRDRDREKSDRKDKDMYNNQGNEVGNDHVEKEERKRSKDKSRDREKEKSKKHKRHHQSKSNEEGVLEKVEKDDAKRSHRHSGDKKKSSRKHGHEQASDGEHKHKRHRKDRDREGRNGRALDLEDGEVGEDGELS